jgi:hypothetical protein
METKYGKRKRRDGDEMKHSSDGVKTILTILKITVLQ